jgi:hypothetical protein
MTVQKGLTRTALTENRLIDMAGDPACCYSTIIA